MSQGSSFEDALDVVLKARIGMQWSRQSRALVRWSESETYRLTVTTASGEKLLAMRRAPGGQVLEKRLNIPVWMLRHC